MPPTMRSAQQTDMLETPQKKLTVRDGEIQLEFKPFEIKTVQMAK